VPDVAHTLTIDELARETGMTVRNIRAHQSRGLLPPPEVRARTGFYGPEHVERLRLVRDLQADGLNLKAIERMLDGPQEREQLLTFGRAARDAFLQEEPELATAAELVERLGGTMDAKQIAKAEKLGLIRHLGEDRYEIPSPTLVGAGEELVALGVPLNHALAVAATIQRHSRQIAAAFVRLFVDDVLGADGDASDPAEWAKHDEALERLRPLAAEAVLAGFQQTMSVEIERALEDQLKRR
jgi:DNA-binding transcriptional MerR regulator